MIAPEINLNDRDLDRYSRHLLLPEFSEKQQWLLSRARILIVGAGGLGSSAALFLAASGIGKIIIADGDSVELSNLQRQIIHDETTIGHNKVDSAHARLTALNSDIMVETLAEKITGARLDDQISRADLIIDGSDNFNTRYAINRCCLLHHKPLVYGAAIGWYGHLSVFDYRPGSACLECLFAEQGHGKKEDCSSSGVFSPLTGVIGSLQASEAIKVISNIGQTSTGKLQCIDLLRSQWRYLKLSADPDCTVCGTKAKRSCPS